MVSQKLVIASIDNMNIFIISRDYAMNSNKILEKYTSLLKATSKNHSRKLQSEKTAYHYWKQIDYNKVKSSINEEIGILAKGIQQKDWILTKKLKFLE